MSMTHNRGDHTELESTMKPEEEIGHKALHEMPDLNEVTHIKAK